MLDKENNKIENYLDGNMSKKEQRGFEKSIQKDARLAKEVAVVQEVNETISQEAKLKAFKEQLSILGDSYFPVEKEGQIVRPLHNRRPRRWLVAASILIIAVSGVFIWSLLNDDLDTEELFATNYEPYRLGQRSNVADGDEVEQQATEAYNNNDFNQAIPLFEKFLVTNSSNEKNILRLGSAYLSTNQAQKAIDIFQPIIANPESALVQAAQWYQALAYLQLENTAEAKKVLNNLANSGNRTYPTKAKKLLKSLN